uniref:Uncharacterized protein n=1 Tax=Ixodes ricinus TaxID=34613 RepID=A0A6B0U029_IXORI
MPLSQSWGILPIFSRGNALTSGVGLVYVTIVRCRTVMQFEGAMEFVISCRLAMHKFLSFNFIHGAQSQL